MQTFSRASTIVLPHLHVFRSLAKIQRRKLLKISYICDTLISKPNSRRRASHGFHSRRRNLFIYLRMQFLCKIRNDSQMKFVIFHYTNFNPYIARGEDPNRKNPVLLPCMCRRRRNGVDDCNARGGSLWRPRGEGGRTRQDVRVEGEAKRSPIIGLHFAPWIRIESWQASRWDPRIVRMRIRISFPFSVFFSSSAEGSYNHR